MIKQWNFEEKGGGKEGEKIKFVLFWALYKHKDSVLLILFHNLKGVVC